jgi:2-succinyl-5-enolpyruvyl-6-hydroxy-3-cyclohexene-1-carboxylate synthase
MNESLALSVLQEAIEKGVKEFCFCPGGRNSPLFFALEEERKLKKYYWFEERSAAFFAL